MELMENREARLNSSTPRELTLDTVGIVGAIAGFVSAETFLGGVVQGVVTGILSRVGGAVLWPKNA